MLLFNKLKSKTGSSTVYELLISLTLLTFVMMFPIGLFSFLRAETAINDVTTLAMQTLERDGQLTPELIATIDDNLIGKQLPALGGENGTIIISNMTVSQINPSGTTIQSKLNDAYIRPANTAKGIPAFNGKYSDFVYVTSDVITAPFNGSISSLSIPSSNGNQSTCGYLKKYRNAFIAGPNSSTIWYDVKCNNTACSKYHIIQYISKDQKFRCPACGKVNALETCNESNVVYITIAVPITDKVAFLNRIMGLISFGTSNVDAIFAGNEDGTILDSKSYIENNGKYYFVRTLYSTAEKYYYVGGGL